MAEAKTGLYGSWKSPINATAISSATRSFDQVSLVKGDVYWIESRPAEAGRQVIVRFRNGEATDMIAAPFSARTRVHEYGGGSYVVGPDAIYFCNQDDQRIYRKEAATDPVALTPAGDCRYADLVVDTKRSRLLAVEEDHATQPPRNRLVSIPIAGGTPESLVEGNDFYSSARVSPNGLQVCWLTWKHPNMPWDGTELWLAEFDAEGKPASPRQIAGGNEESIFQPEWSPGGVLHFVSDRSDWWNLYTFIAGDIKSLHPAEADFGRPQWVFGMSTYAFLSDRHLICTSSEKAIWRMAVLDIQTGSYQRLDTPYTEIRSVRAGQNSLVFIGATPRESWDVVRFDLGRKRMELLRRSSELELAGDFISESNLLEFPTDDGSTAYGFFYRPKNRDFVGSDREKPPLIVNVHGGPTGATGCMLSPTVQFWTTRGFAVVEVNFGGSTGFGKKYRKRLEGKFGIVDVNDCISAVRHLISTGQVDPSRVVIRGGSSGGYTALAAVTFHDTFKAAASYFGISDLELLFSDTHKFESRYGVRLVGPFPEAKQLYRDRSPIHSADKVSSPVIFFQGLNDKVVPPNQTEQMYQALKSKGTAVAYISFEGEEHGFRKAETIRRALDAELYFYSRVFGIVLAEPIEAIPIDNLPS